MQRALFLHQTLFFFPAGKSIGGALIFFRAKWERQIRIVLIDQSCISGAAATKRGANKQASKQRIENTHYSEWWECVCSGALSTVFYNAGGAADQTGVASGVMAPVHANPSAWD